MFAPVTAPLDTLLGRQEFRCAVQIQRVFTRINNEYTLQLCPLEHMLSLLLIRNNYLCRKYSPKRRATETTAQKLKPNANEMKCRTYKTKHTSDRWMLPREWKRAGERESERAAQQALNSRQWEGEQEQDIPKTLDTACVPKLFSLVQRESQIGCSRRALLTVVVGVLRWAVSRQICREQAKQRKQEKWGKTNVIR